MNASKTVGASADEDTGESDGERRGSADVLEFGIGPTGKKVDCEPPEGCGDGEVDARLLEERVQR